MMGGGPSVVYGSEALEALTVCGIIPHSSGLPLPASGAGGSLRGEVDSRPVWLTAMVRFRSRRGRVSAWRPHPARRAARLR